MNSENFILSFLGWMSFYENESEMELETSLLWYRRSISLYLSKRCSISVLGRGRSDGKGYF